MKRHSLLGSGSTLILSTLLVLLVCSNAISQQGTGAVRGVVKDPQGNVIAGARR